MSALVPIGLIAWFLWIASHDWRADRGLARCCSGRLSVREVFAAAERIQQHRDVPGDDLIPDEPADDFARWEAEVRS